ncbi:MAG: indole-3-glycerol-phosphate synthase [Methanoregula sp.]|jgi:indole-3-glycerol phosphate synthase|uniref:indole-3-glycerol phosphate synthase TrpC n=1 Tax=Methanoregula sp. TaxID=2052170 RepID=UPI0025DA3BDE|nr:indole-3-glycerol-phosphate synthase [Methanoregula sp.]MCK9631174.1 indole-3-glycerol-phosphate synthase [Methanoregula sp.]
MILDDIIRRTEKRVAQLPSSFPEPASEGPPSLSGAIRGRNGKNAVIAEIKCASPSGGIIRRNVDMAQMAGVLAGAGCVALSVLTEPYFFGGTGLDIARVKTTVDIPVLRKDFIIDERQIAESKALGADAVLLIAAVLKKNLPAFVDLAMDYHLEPLVEVHNTEEAESALSTRATLIGINNRDLSTMTINRSTTRLLSGQIRPKGRLIVSESGMRSADDVREMRGYCDAFLIGSSIMADAHPRKKLEEFVCA